MFRHQGATLRQFNNNKAQYQHVINVAVALADTLYEAFCDPTLLYFIHCISLVCILNVTIRDAVFTASQVLQEPISQ